MGDSTSSRDRTRLRILTAAQQLFAERGLDGVSLREIGAAAGQRNNSAVQYHFGGRDALIRSLYELRLEPLNVRRGELVEAIVRQHREDDLNAILDAFARPLFEIADGSSWYARFVARYVAFGNGDKLEPPLDARFTSSMHTVIDLLRRATSSLPAPIRAERTRRMQLYVTAAIADVEGRRSRDEPLGVAAETSLRDLVATAAAMMSAAAPIRPKRGTR